MVNRQYLQTFKGMPQLLIIVHGLLYANFFFTLQIFVNFKILITLYSADVFATVHFNTNDIFVVHNEEQINMTSSLVAIQDIFSFVSLTLFQSPFSIRCNEEGRYYTQSSQ